MAQGPRFDTVVPPHGYAWWYLDATSADGRYGLTVIAFVGSVFSPYYKLVGRQRPDNHCAINIAINGPRARAWAMTERGQRAVNRGPDHFHVGPSSVEWDGECLTIAVDERSAPLPYRVRGRIRLWPDLIATTGFALDGEARHRWHPIAPRARVEVAMDHPDADWTGSGYLDSNFGDEPLENGFRDWHWSRTHLSRDVAVLYEGMRRDGRPFGLAMLCDRQGRWREADAPPPHRLGRTGWAIDRRTRADRDSRPRVARTWIDAPFYARSGIDTRLFGERCFAVHETLSLDRFASPVVQSMLPYRMPRAIL
ncbi:hydratase [Sphingomonas sp.]